MRRVTFFLATIFLFLADYHSAYATPSSALARTTTEPLAETSDTETQVQINVRGWDYLVAKLIAIGLPQEEIIRIFSDRRMPFRTEIPFKLAPRETHLMYNQFTTDSKINVGLTCLKSNLHAFEQAEQRFGVSRYILAALILVETQCGKVLGQSMILNRLARVSSVGEPANLQYNYEELKAQDATVTYEAVQARADYLERTFFPEVQALIEVAKRKDVDVFDLKGSPAGAFGIPQFLPTSYLKYGLDGNGDGHISLFDPSDAILSAANYLHSFGWKETEDANAKKAVLWNYNRSEAYGDAVLKAAILLKQRALSPKKSTPLKATKLPVKPLTGTAKKLPLSTKKHSPSQK